MLVSTELDRIKAPQSLQGQTKAIWGPVLTCILTRTLDHTSFGKSYKTS